jgi:hypothetical protein
VRAKFTDVADAAEIDFDVPTSRYVSWERTPPEDTELCLLLREAAIPCQPRSRGAHAL